MLNKTWFGLPLWSVLAPLVACATLVLAWGPAPSALLIALVAAVLIAAVLVAVHHAEVIAHRIGEPLGTLVLAVAVTVIEVALIVSMMLPGGQGAGGMRHRVLTFRIDGTGPALSVLAALSTLTLIVPDYTLTTPGPLLSTAQLLFVGVVSLALYAVFVFVQTVRHRDYFLPIEPDAEHDHAPPPTTVTAVASTVLLFISLITVVGLAKLLAPAIQSGVESAGAPLAVVGIAIALLVLLPETWAAVRAAVCNRMQTSLNLALGSVLATIGLTIPTVAAVSIAIGLPLELGLAPKEAVMLALTLFISAITLATGRATIMQGAVHLVLFAAFLFLAIVP